MATIGRTLLRFTGALLVGASATAIDHPGVLHAPGPRRFTGVPVVVAGRDIPEGTRIDPASLMVALWPSGTTPPGAYADVDGVVGRVSRVPIYKGEAIVPGRLAPEGTGAGLEGKITPGKRAFGIRVNDVASLAGMVQPNSRVDIMVVIDDPKQSKRVAKLFMENMRVLAIGTAPERAQNGAPINTAVASIEVTPQEAERLAIAGAQGTIQLVLRGYGDPDSVDPAALPRFAEPGIMCGEPSRPTLVRDLLRRSCAAERLEFRRDSMTRVRPAR